MLTIAILVAACATPEPDGPDPLVSPLNSPVQAPLSLLDSLGLPAPQPGTGAVIGRLVSNSENGPPYTGGDLYLGTHIEADQPGLDPIIAFTEGVDPKAVIYNPDGTFAFTDIVPGSYSLIFWTPISSFVIEDPEGNSIRIDVEADKTLNLKLIVGP